MIRMLSLMLVLAIINACGKKNDSSKPALPSSEVVSDYQLPEDGSNVEGTYLAKFQTLNPHINGNVPGSATIKRESDKLFAYIRLFSAAPNAWHQQFIAIGNRCPGPQDDMNADGFIDIEEGNRVWGEILIPLDSNLGSQVSGKNIYPVGDDTGSYFYESTTSFKRLFEDLKSADRNVTDNIAKLEPGQGLGIEGKVVVVLGVAPEAEISETVASLDGQRPYQNLPVSCGTFQKVTNEPGAADDGVIPGPVGPVEPEGGPVEDGHTLPPDVPEYPEETTPIDTTPRDEEASDWYDRFRGWWDDIFD